MSGPGALPEIPDHRVHTFSAEADLFTRAQVEQVRDEAYAAGQADERAQVKAEVRTDLLRWLADLPTSDMDDEVYALWLQVYARVGTLPRGEHR